MTSLKVCGALVVALLSGMSASVFAAEKTSAEKTISDALRASRPDFVVTDVTPVKGQALYEVTLASGDILYATPDGQYFVYGSLFQVAPGKLTNVTAQKQDVQRASLMAKVSEKDMIVFKAKGKEKALINVFTDIDCGYCRKLHQEVSKLNEMGITVRYLAYPRAGVWQDQARTQYTGSFKKIKSVWCATDRKDAMTKAKTTGFIAENLKCDAPIEAQLELGEQMGVKGTPAIVLANGEMIGGYLPADQMAQRLGL